MDQLDIALSAAIDESPYTPAEVAKRIGLRPQILRNKLCSTTDSNKLALREAVRLCRSVDDYRPFEVIAQMFGCQLVPMTHDDPVCVVQSVLAAAAECGDVPRAVHDALADGVITSREQGELRKEIKQARDTLNALEAAIDQKAKGEVINLEQRS